MASGKWARGEEQETVAQGGVGSGCLDKLVQEDGHEGGPEGGGQEAEPSVQNRL